MRGANPFVIARNHMVEAALSAASDHGEMDDFNALLQVFARPYEARPGLERYRAPPKAEERVAATFCGT